MSGSTLRGAAWFAEKWGADLDRPPEGGRWTKWLCGVVAPVSLIAWGAYALVRRQPPVVGVFWASLGLFVHFHYFWGLSRRLQPYSELAKTLAAIPLIGAICYGVIHFFAFM